MNSDIQQLAFDSTVPTIEKMIPIFIGTSKTIVSEKPTFTDNTYEVIQLSTNNEYEIDQNSIIPYITYWKLVSAEFFMNFQTPTYIVYLPDINPGIFDKESIFVLYNNGQDLLFSSKIKSFTYDNGSLTSLELVDKCPFVGDYSFALISKVKENLLVNYNSSTKQITINTDNFAFFNLLETVFLNESTVTYNIYNKSVELKTFQTITSEDITNEQNPAISKGLSLSNSAVVINIPNDTFINSVIELIKTLDYGYYIVPIDLSINSIKALSSYVQFSESNTSYKTLLIPAGQAENKIISYNNTYIPPTFTWSNYGPAYSALTTPSIGSSIYGISGTKLFVGPTQGNYSKYASIFDFSNNIWVNNIELPVTFGAFNNSAIFTCQEAPIYNGQIYIRGNLTNPPMLFNIQTQAVQTMTVLDIVSYTLSSNPVVLAPNNKVYYFGQSVLGSPYSENGILSHNLINDTWTLEKQTTTNWLGHTTPINIGNGKIFVIPGYSPNQPGYIFDTNDNSFTQSNNTCGLNCDTVNTMSSILLKDGRVLVAGGTTSKLSIYDPITNNFTVINIGRSFEVSPALFLMEDGRVHIISNYNGGGSFIFNPTDNSYTTAYSMPNTLTSSICINPINGNPVGISAANGSTPVLFSIFDGK